MTIEYLTFTIFNVFCSFRINVIKHLWRSRLSTLLVATPSWLPVRTLAGPGATDSTECFFLRGKLEDGYVEHSVEIRRKTKRLRRHQAPKANKLSRTIGLSQNSQDRESSRIEQPHPVNFGEVNGRGARPSQASPTMCTPVRLLIHIRLRSTLAGLDPAVTYIMLVASDYVRPTWGAHNLKLRYALT